MQFLKKIILSTTTLFTFSAMQLLSSCAPKNSCDTLVCQNGGTCASEFCSCVTGYDGAQCENKITDRYIGTYAGNTRPRNGQATHKDTVDVYVSANPLTLSLLRRRQPELIFNGVIQSANNSIVINDIIDGANRTVINATLKAASIISHENKILNLNVVEYTNGIKMADFEFSGEYIGR